VFSGLLVAESTDALISETIEHTKDLIGAHYGCPHPPASPTSEGAPNEAQNDTGIAPHVAPDQALLRMPSGCGCGGSVVSSEGRVCN
jgi:hypothetical protein